jgi:hypothetical protein
MKKIITIGLIAVLVAGCAPQPAKPQKTSLEIQAIQARTFDADKKITFNSVMSVLQDLGYIIGSASFETGFITAVSPNKRVDSPAAQLALLFSNSIRTEGKTAVTVSIEEISSTKTRVRLNLVDRQVRTNAYGQKAGEDIPIEDPKTYESAFDKIGEAIFIRQAQTSPAAPKKTTK